MGNVIDQLIHGLVLPGSDKPQREFEMREALAEDMFAAEVDADASRPVTYRAALIARQLVRIGEFRGPFTLGLVGKLKGKDLAILIDAQRRLDESGEDEQPG